MGEIGPDRSELSALEFEKWLYLTLVILLRLYYLPVDFDKFCTKDDPWIITGLAPGLINLYIDKFQAIIRTFYG